MIGLLLGSVLNERKMCRSLTAINVFPVPGGPYSTVIEG